MDHHGFVQVLDRMNGRGNKMHIVSTNSMPFWKVSVWHSAEKVIFFAWKKCAGETEATEEVKVIGRMTWPSSSERALIEVGWKGVPTVCELHHLSNPELVDLFQELLYTTLYCRDYSVLWNFWLTNPMTSSSIPRLKTQYLPEASIMGESWWSYCRSRGMTWTKEPKMHCGSSTRRSLWPSWAWMVAEIRSLV